MIKRILFAPPNRWGPVKRTGQSISGGTSKPPSSGGIKKGGSNINRNQRIKHNRKGSGDLQKRLTDAALSAGTDFLKKQALKHATKQIQKIVQKSPQKTQEPSKAEEP